MGLLGRELRVWLFVFHVSEIITRKPLQARFLRTGWKKSFMETTHPGFDSWTCGQIHHMGRKGNDA